jgi:hypothetical protein
MLVARIAFDGVQTSFICADRLWAPFLRRLQDWLAAACSAAGP